MVFHCTSPTRSRPGRRFYGRRFIRERGRGQFLQTCGAKALQKRFGHRKSADGRHYRRPLHQPLCWIDRQQEFRRKGTRIAALWDVRSGQAIEDRANGETNAAWVDEDRAVNSRDAQLQLGRERGSRGARLRYPRDQKRSTEPFAPVDRTTAISGVYFEPGAPVGDE
jgi:hypothetical protein